LSYLKDLQIDELKIDKIFVDNIVENANDRAIATSIIDLAKNLNLNIVAEGVENPEQFDLLLDLGCQVFQGYLFGRPVPERDFVEQLKRGNLMPSQSL